MNTQVNFEIWTKSDCPYCAKLKDTLDTLELQYSENVIDEDISESQFKITFGEDAAIPRVHFTNELNEEIFLGGCDDCIRWMLFARDKGHI